MINLPTDFGRKYRLIIRKTLTFGSWKHEWSLIGRHGGVHLHISGPHVYDNSEHWSAGLEFHYRSPPEYMENDPPSHDRCWLIECPCWHDGTILYAQEHYLPMFLMGDDARILRGLMRDADEKFGGANDPHIPLRHHV
jgi:hypothetical protein